MDRNGDLKTTTFPMEKRFGFPIMQLKCCPIYQWIFQVAGASRQATSGSQKKNEIHFGGDFCLSPEVHFWFTQRIQMYGIFT